MDMNKNNFATPAVFTGKKGNARPLGKMVLPITNPDSKNFYHALGITQERATQIADQLDQHLQRLDGQFILTHEIYATAVSFCNNLEEVVVAVAMVGKFLEQSEGFQASY